MDVHYVIESIGLFTNKDAAAKHLNAEAKRVIISAPATNPDKTVAMSVNEEAFDPREHKIISMASCTTGSLAPPAKVFERQLCVRALSVIPTTTGAARAIGEIIPELKGKLDGHARLNSFP